MPRPNDSFLDWLDTVVKAKQPLVHYQILGLPMFEEDPQKIRQAVQRQVKALWSHAHGPYAHRVRKGRQLVDRASRYLLNPRLKTAYDAELRQRFSVLAPAPQPPVVNIQTVDFVGERLSTAERDSNRTLIFAAVATFVCVAAAVVLAFTPGFGRDPAKKEVAQAVDEGEVALKAAQTATKKDKKEATLVSAPAPATTSGAAPTPAPVAPPPPPVSDQASSGRLIVGEKTIEVFPESVAANSQPQTTTPATPANPQPVAPASNDADEELTAAAPLKEIEPPPVPKLTGPANSLWKANAGKIRSLAVSPDGRTLITGGFDRTVRWWDVESGKEIRRFAGHRDNVYDVAFRGDGLQIASCGADGRVLVWNLKGEDEARVLEGHQGAVQRLAFLHKSGKLVTAGSDQTIRVWNLASGLEEQCLKGNDRWMSLAVSPDDAFVLAGGRDGSLVLFSLATGKIESSFEGHTGALHSVAFLADGGRILSAAWDGSVRLWDTETTAELERFEGAGSGQATLVVSPDGDRFATGGEDGRISLWDVTTRRPLATYDGHRDRVARIAFQPGSGAMVSASWDEAVRYWQTP